MAEEKDLQAEIQRLSLDLSGVKAAWRCHGEGEIRVNPGYPDPQTETSAKCPGCPDCEPPNAL